MNKKWKDGRTRENQAIRAFIKKLTEEAAKEMKKKEDYIGNILVFSLKEDGNMEDLPFLSWLSSRERQAERKFLREERRREVAGRTVRETTERIEREE